VQVEAHPVEVQRGVACARFPKEKEPVRRSTGGERVRQRTKGGIMQMRTGFEAAKDDDGRSERKWAIQKVWQD
jgi:hypothetical protein